MNNRPEMVHRTQPAAIGSRLKTPHTPAQPSVRLSGMATNLEIAPSPLNEAVEVGKHRSKRAAVEAALIEYVNRHKQAEIIGVNHLNLWMKWRRLGSVKVWVLSASCS
jgi:hypothetical protein